MTFLKYITWYYMCIYICKYIIYILYAIKNPLKMTVLCLMLVCEYSRGPKDGGRTPSIRSNSLCWADVPKSDADVSGSW